MQIYIRVDKMIYTNLEVQGIRTDLVISGTKVQTEKISGRFL